MRVRSKGSPTRRRFLKGLLLLTTGRQYAQTTRGILRSGAHRRRQTSEAEGGHKPRASQDDSKVTLKSELTSIHKFIARQHVVVLGLVLPVVLLARLPLLFTVSQNSRQQGSCIASPGMASRG